MNGIDFIGMIVVIGVFGYLIAFTYEMGKERRKSKDDKMDKKDFWF